MKLIANIDGASFGNPGSSGLGVYIRDGEGKVLAEHSEHLGHGTNNRAEYMALIRSIELAEKLGCDELEVRSDSQLVVSQMNGVYRIKNGDMKALAMQVKEKLSKAHFKFAIKHVPRELNREADRLAKKGAEIVVQE